MNELKSSAKPFEISKWEVWQAYEKVKANKGAPGVDGVRSAEFETDLKSNLYKIWNRMSSGTLLPASGACGGDTEAAWRRHEGLGVPTVADRIAQTVVAAEAGGEGRADLPSGLLRLPAGAVGAGRGRGHAGRGVGRTTG